MKFAALTVFLAATSACGAADLATQLTVARIDYDLPAFEKPATKDSFVFRMFIQLALSDISYAVECALNIPEGGEAGGSLTLVERSGQDRTSRSFALSHAQAREVFGWFSDAKFLDPKIAEVVEVQVLDGDGMLIEGFVGGRYFRVHRNSGDSASSAVFFRRVEMFRTWKEEPNQPNAGSRPSSADSSASETPSTLGPRG